MFYILFACYVILSCLGLLLIKLGGGDTSLSFQANSFSMVMSYRLVIGLLCYICSFLLFTLILQKRDLSLIYPLSAGVINILSVVLGIVVLKEKISTFGLIGMVLVITGVVFLSIKR